MKIEEIPEISGPELSRQLMFGPVRPAPTIPLLVLGCIWLFVSAFALGLWGVDGFTLIYCFIFFPVSLAIISALLISLSSTRSLMLAKHGKPEAALKMLNRAVTWTGSVRPYILPRGQMLLGLGLPAQAREYLEARWEEIPKNVIAHAKAARATCWVLEESNLFEAISEFSELRKEHPNWHDLALTQGMAYFQLRQYEEALPLLERGMDLIDKTPNIRKESLYFALGECQREVGDPMRAAEYFKKSRAAIEERRKKFGVKSDA